MIELDAVFNENGALAKVIEGYHPRVAQIEMATAITTTIKNQHTLIAEAGTGTGKTFAYLIPAVLSQQKVIISTATKNLQEQLFNQDLPLIRRALKNQSFQVALLKGRANYLCQYRLRNALESTQGFDKKTTKELMAIQKWAKYTPDGDIATMPSLSEYNSVWYQATSTRENCLGSECPDTKPCFLAKARRQAHAADVVIVNHYLFFADGLMKETGGELLSNADIIILDEAHQLTEIASNFMGVTLTGKQFTDLSLDTLEEYFKEAKDMPDLRTAADDLKHEVRDLRLAFGTQLRKGDWSDIEKSPKISAALENLQQQLIRLNRLLKQASVKSTGLNNCYQRCKDLRTQLSDLLKDQSQAIVRWYETHRLSFTLGLTPLAIATEFEKFRQHYSASWIFTSATLSIAGNFEHFSTTLGLEHATYQRWDSPFDYQHQALFYHPKGLPQPNDADAIERIVEFVLPVLKASKGRAFFLFTSYRALNKAADLLAEQLDYPLLVQGTQSKQFLLKTFKQQGHTVLLGTASFWEGVDVRGEALSCVIIDKLPFASPFEPILKARLAFMKQQGQNGFMDYQVPLAITALRQGVGRLIRDVNDRGLLMVCDPRLLKRGYGQTFLDSLPPMRRTREIDEVNEFFK